MNAGRQSLLATIPTLAGLCALLALAVSCGDAGDSYTPADRPFSPTAALTAEGSSQAADADLQPAAAPAATWTFPHRVLWLHRSVGGNIVRNGAVDMYDVLDSLNAVHGTDLEFWHHFCGSPPYWNRYYDGNDEWVEPNFGPAIGEPEQLQPRHLKSIFCDDDPQYVAARDSIDEFKLILFKSGYDNTIALATDQVAEWRDLYRTMKDSPLFTDLSRRIIVMGFPPNRQGVGPATQADADSGRAFNEWLVEEYVADRDNLFGFPLWDIMADTDNWLRDEYELVDYPNDGHPNAYGSEIIGRFLMRFIHELARQPGDPDPPALPRPGRRFDPPLEDIGR